MDIVFSKAKANAMRLDTRPSPRAVGLSAKAYPNSHTGLLPSSRVRTVPMRTTRRSSSSSVRRGGGVLPGAMKRNQARTFGRSISGGIEYDFNSDAQAEGQLSFSALARPLLKVQSGIESRVAADPDFLFKLLWEIVQDQFIIVLTVIGSCGLPMFWTPSQLAHACLLHATALMNDVLLMYFLAPVAGESKQAGGLSHMFEPGNATIAQRLRVWVDKFFLYAPLGFLTAVLSSFVLSGVVNEPINMFYLTKVGLVGFLHLGISSNTRYQMINGADVLYYKVMDKGAARGATIASRLVNQVAGGKLFLMLSNFIL